MRRFIRIEGCALPVDEIAIVIVEQVSLKWRLTVGFDEAVLTNDWHWDYDTEAAARKVAEEIYSWLMPKPAQE